MGRGKDCTWNLAQRLRHEQNTDGTHAGGGSVCKGCEIQGDCTFFNGGAKGRTFAPAPPWPMDETSLSSNSGLVARSFFMPCPTDGPVMGNRRRH